MRRRRFLAIAVGAAGHSMTALAQGRVRRVGVLLAAYAEADPDGQLRVAAFRRALEELGWREDRVRVAYHWGGGSATNAGNLASELLHSSPDVIVVSGDPALTQLQRLSTTIPIVFTQVSEPVDSGFVSSLARPGGHITGFQNFEPAMGGNGSVCSRRSRRQFAGPERCSARTPPRTHPSWPQRKLLPPRLISK